MDEKTKDRIDAVSKYTRDEDELWIFQNLLKFKKGNLEPLSMHDVVEVARRCGKGENLVGGIGRIIWIHNGEDEGFYDVQLIGTREKRVDRMFIRFHETGQPEGSASVLPKKKRKRSQERCEGCNAFKSECRCYALESTRKVPWQAPPGVHSRAAAAFRAGRKTEAEKENFLLQVQEKRNSRIVCGVTRVRKDFSGTLYEGTVVKEAPLSQPPIYHVRYDDGDSEDLSENEVFAHIVSPLKESDLNDATSERNNSAEHSNPEQHTELKEMKGHSPVMTLENQSDKRDSDSEQEFDPAMPLRGPEDFSNEANDLVNPSPLQMQSFKVGDLVNVKARCGPHMNKQGGVGRVMKVNSDNTYDVKYVLGDHMHERSIPVQYIRPEAFSLNTREVQGRCPIHVSFLGDCGCALPGVSFLDGEQKGRGDIENLDLTQDTAYCPDPINDSFKRSRKATHASSVQLHSLLSSDSEQDIFSQERLLSTQRPLQNRQVISDTSEEEENIYSHDPSQIQDLILDTSNRQSNGDQRFSDSSEEDYTVNVKGIDFEAAEGNRVSQPYSNASSQQSNNSERRKEMVMYSGDDAISDTVISDEDSDADSLYAIDEDAPTFIQPERGDGEVLPDDFRYTAVLEGLDSKSRELRMKKCYKYLEEELPKFRENASKVCTKIRKFQKLSIKRQNIRNEEIEIVSEEVVYLTNKFNETLLCGSRGYDVAKWCQKELNRLKGWKISSQIMGISQSQLENLELRVDNLKDFAESELKNVQRDWAKFQDSISSEDDGSSTDEPEETIIADERNHRKIRQSSKTAPKPQSRNLKYPARSGRHHTFPPRKKKGLATDLAKARERSPFVDSSSDDEAEYRGISFPPGMPSTLQQGNTTGVRLVRSATLPVMHSNKMLFRKEAAFQQKQKRPRMHNDLFPDGADHTEPQWCSDEDPIIEKFDNAMDPNDNPSWLQSSAPDNQTSCQRNNELVENSTSHQADVPLQGKRLSSAQSQPAIEEQEERPQKMKCYMNDLLNHACRKWPVPQDRKPLETDTIYVNGITIPLRHSWIDGGCLDMICSRLFSELSRLLTKVYQDECSFGEKASSLSSEAIQIILAIDSHIMKIDELYLEVESKAKFSETLLASVGSTFSKDYTLNVYHNHKLCTEGIVGVNSVFFTLLCYFHQRVLCWIFALKDAVHDGSLTCFTPADHSWTVLDDITRIFFQNPDVVEQRGKKNVPNSALEPSLNPIGGILKCLIDGLGCDFWKACTASIDKICSEENCPITSSWKSNKTPSHRLIHIVEVLWRFVAQCIRVQLSEFISGRKKHFITNWELIKNMLEVSPLNKSLVGAFGESSQHSRNEYVSILLVRLYALMNYWKSDEDLIISIWQRCLELLGTGVYQYTLPNRSDQERGTYFQMPESDPMIFFSKIVALAAEGYGMCKLPALIFSAKFSKTVLLKMLREWSTEDCLFLVPLFLIQTHLGGQQKQLHIKRFIAKKLLKNMEPDSLHSNNLFEKQDPINELQKIRYNVTTIVFIVKAGFGESADKLLPKLENFFAWSSLGSEKALIMYLQGAVLIALQLISLNAGNDVAMLNKWVNTWIKRCFDKAMSLYDLIETSSQCSQGLEAENHIERANSLFSLSLGTLKIWIECIISSNSANKVNTDAKFYCGQTQSHFFSTLELIGSLNKPRAKMSRMAYKFCTQILQLLIPPLENDKYDNEKLLSESKCFYQSKIQKEQAPSTDTQQVEETDIFWDDIDEEALILAADRAEQTQQMQNKQTFSDNCQPTQDYLSRVTSNLLALVKDLLFQSWHPSQLRASTSKYIPYFDDSILDCFSKILLWQCQIDMYGWKNLRNEILKPRPELFSNDPKYQGHRLVGPAFLLKILSVPSLRAKILAGAEKEALAVWLRSISDPQVFAALENSCAGSTQVPQKMEMNESHHVEAGLAKLIHVFSKRMEVSLQESHINSVFHEALNSDFHTPAFDIFEGLQDARSDNIILIFRNVQLVLVRLSQQWDNLTQQNLASNRKTLIKAQVGYVVEDFARWLGVFFKELGNGRSTANPFTETSFYKEYLYAVVEQLLVYCTQPIKGPVMAQLVRTFYKPLVDRSPVTPTLCPIMAHYLPSLMISFSKAPYTMSPVQDYIQSFVACSLGSDCNDSKDSNPKSAESQPQFNRSNWKKTFIAALRCPMRFKLDHTPNYEERDCPVLRRCIRKISSARLGNHWNSDSFHIFRRIVLSRIVLKTLKKLKYEECLAYFKDIYIGERFHPEIPCPNCCLHGYLEKPEVEFWILITKQAFQAALNFGNSVPTRLILQSFDVLKMISCLSSKAPEPILSSTLNSVCKRTLELTFHLFERIFLKKAMIDVSVLFQGIEAVELVLRRCQRFQTRFDDWIKTILLLLLVIVCGSKDDSSQNNKDYFQDYFSNSQAFRVIPDVHHQQEAVQHLDPLVIKRTVDVLECKLMRYVSADARPEILILIDELK